MCCSKESFWLGSIRGNKETTTILKGDTTTIGYPIRVLPTVKNSAVNADFPIWPMVEPSNLCFPNT